MKLKKKDYGFKTAINGLSTGVYINRVLTDRIISDFIHDPILEIVKIIRFIFISIFEISLWIKIQFDYYLSVSDRLTIIHQYPTLFKSIRSAIIRIKI
jgi:hypothetical protein